MTRTTRQLEMFATEYQEASFARDRAAYAVVGILESCIFWLKQGDAAHVLRKLEDAKTRYEKTAAALNLLDPDNQQHNQARSAAA